MTKKHIFISIIISICFSCKNNSNKNIINNNISKLEKQETEIKQKSDLNLTKKESNQVIRKKVKVISVEETLIMPRDYLTTAMTVKTDENKHLIFLDMNGFEKLIDKEITIEYKLISGSKLLLCFNCSSYSKEIKLYDITSFYSKTEYKELQLKKYVADKWITPSSTFEMLNKSGKTETFTTNDNDMILDSLKMKSTFYKYGIITSIHPELLNRTELEDLLN